RGAAVGSALRAAPDVEPALAAALDTPQAAAAARLLGAARFPGAAATLSARLGDPRLEGAAADALVALGAAAVPALARALAADDPAMAAGAAHILGDLGAPEAVPALVGALAR